MASLACGRRHIMMNHSYVTVEVKPLKSWGAEARYKTGCPENKLLHCRKLIIHTVLWLVLVSLCVTKIQYPGIITAECLNVTLTFPSLLPMSLPDVSTISTLFVVRAMAR